jgi:hypothetical protein
MPEFTIGKQVFRTKGKALEAVQQVLRSSLVGKPLTGSDYILIRALIDLHPVADEKLAGGCKAIVVRINKLPGMPPQRGFWIIHDDGTEIDFSIYVPFKNANQRKVDQLAWAAREAVRSEIEQFKRLQFRQRKTIPCQITGRLVTWDEAHVHHAGEWPFVRILTEWIASRSAPPTIIDLGITKALADEDAVEFLKFHNSRATLQVVHQIENARIGSRGSTR